MRRRFTAEDFEEQVSRPYYTTNQFEDILSAACEYDEDLEMAWIFFTEDKSYAVIQQFFEEDNYDHHDSWTDEYIEVNSRKVLKNIIKGKDAAELIRFAFDFGRLVGRAEKILRDQPTSCSNR